MKYLYFIIFSLICVFFLYLIIKRTEKKQKEQLEKYVKLSESKLRLIKIQEQFVTLDLNGGFKNYPNMRKYICNALSVLNYYDNIERAKFKGCSLEEEMKMFLEAQDNLKTKQYYLFVETNKVVNLLCSTINYREYCRIVRKKKSELRKMLYLVKFIEYFSDFKRFCEKTCNLIRKIGFYEIVDTMYSEENVNKECVEQMKEKQEGAMSFA